ncbi:MAG: thymidylate synthase, partial [Hyphomonadaceae bacterium]
HFDQARTQLARTPYAPPQMLINMERKDIFAFEYGDFKLEGYEAHEAIAAPLNK